MLIELNLDEKLVSKIKELLRSGEYETEKDVLVRAIENLYERTMASDGLAGTFSDYYQLQMQQNANKDEGKVAQFNKDAKIDIIARDSAGSETVVEVKENTFNSRLDTTLLNSLLISIFDETEPAIDPPDKPDKYQCVIPKPEEIYGTPYTGLIWGFHNRFFPVKFIITALAKIMVEKKQGWIDFGEFRSEIGLEVMPLISIISKMNFRGVIPTVGFPKTFEMFKDMPRLRKMGRNRRDEKAHELVITSKNRFIDQFVGRELNSDDRGNRRVAGACFEMNLMKAGSWDEDSALQVTLTDLGQKFLELDNPIYKQLWELDVFGKPIENIFSELEANFIIENIIPRFELEDMVVMEFLTLSKKTSVDEITDRFLDMQKEYLQEKNPEGYDKYKDYLEKNGAAMATTIMTRLVELGKVKRIKRGLNVFYSL